MKTITQFLTRMKRYLPHALLRRGGERKVSDVGRVPSAKPLMLRERVLRIELSERKVRYFFKKHRAWVMGGIFLVVGAVAVKYALLGFASTADFFPSSCLGSWENVENALGKPSVGAGAPPTSFTALNSAVFSSGTAQIFCGNFAGDTDIGALEAKSFEHATLALSWTFVYPEPVPEGAPSSMPTGTTDETSSTEAVAPTSPAPPPESTPSPTTTTDSSVALPAATTTDDIAPAAATSAPTSTSAGGTTAPDAVSSPPSSTESLPPTSAPTSWVKKILGIAYAEDLGTATMAVVSSDTPTSSADQAQSSTPEQASPPPIQVNTSILNNIVLPPGSPDDVVNISYSTDGTNWIPIANVGKDTWQSGRFTVPISSWNELRKLQIALVGLGTATSSPTIYLDAATLEVSYVDAPAVNVDIAPAPVSPPPSVGDATGAPGILSPGAAPDTNGGGASGQTGESPDINVPPTTNPPYTPPIGPIIQQKPVPLGDIFEQGARQQCVVAPFSKEVSKGGSVDFSLQLFSGLSTAPGTASVLPIYQVRPGSLPTGVSASIEGIASSHASSSQVIHMHAGAGAVQGSYNILVIYRERQDDTSAKSTGCQLNLVIQ